jgi:hypothetical protein
MTSNQRYAALNRRFERRAKFLRRFGFRYLRVPEIDRAVFARRGVLRREDIVTAAEVMLACPAIWRDMLARLLRRT